jgi:hypothetical protein
LWLYSSLVPAFYTTFSIIWLIETTGMPRSTENLKICNCNMLPLGDFIREDVRWSEECYFGGYRPSFDETFVLIKRTLLDIASDSVQHLLIIIPSFNSD